MPQISIIVPVYNTEKYLHRCVDSILAQTYTDFELLLIDDGSTDSSGAICDEYAMKDSRVRVFHKENGGASSARNLGLDNAEGEWITFVDSDDWIDVGFYEDMVSTTMSNKCDMVVCSVAIEHFGQCIHKLHCPMEYAEKRSMLNYTMIEGPIYSSLYNKLICRNIIKNNNLSFDVRLGLWDDMWFVLRIRFLATHIVIVNKSFYHYEYMTPCSLTKESLQRKADSQILCASLFQDFFKKYNASKQYEDLILFLKFHAKNPLFENGLYKRWLNIYAETNHNVWKLKSYYGFLRLLQFCMVIYGGNIGIMMLRLYKSIKSTILNKARH